jgi:hypothetical protein
VINSAHAGEGYPGSKPVAVQAMPLVPAEKRVSSAVVP